jgi:cytochrome c peroxidase
LTSLLTFLAMVLLAAGARGADLPVSVGALPPGFLPVPVPEDNPLTAAKAELGRLLFFDTRLSADGSFACSTCHQPAHAFTDGRRRAVGVSGQQHPRNTMALANVAYNASLNWADPGLDRLEEQMQIPMFGLTPVEMGITGHEEEVLARLHSEPRYGPLFESAFPDDEGPIRFDNVIRAIASFQRTLISGSSPYDRYVYWDDAGSLSASARRGMRLFFSKRLGCAQCHAGFNFSGPVNAGGRVEEPTFHNTALYSLDPEGSYPADNQGLYEHTGVATDMGRFRAPSLRNIALTAPYMHDGSLATLEAVIEHYAAGGRAPQNPLKSPQLSGFEVSIAETRDLVSFLESLTDRAFLEDPRFRDPWASP